MPMVSGRARTNIRPCWARAGVSATHTLNGYLRAAWLDSRCVICSSVRGNVARSRGGDRSWAGAGANTPQVKLSSADTAPARAGARRRHRNMGSFGIGVLELAFLGLTTRLVLEDGVAGEIEAAHQNAGVAAQGARGGNAEAARDDAPGAL